MLASPSLALDLPLKILVAEDATGKVWITYNAPAYLQARHNLPVELAPQYRRHRIACRQSRRIDTFPGKLGEPVFSCVNPTFSILRSKTPHATVSE